jgi:hypothetical protein
MANGSSRKNVEQGVSPSSLDTALQIAINERRLGSQRRARFYRRFERGVAAHDGQVLRFMTLPLPGGDRAALRRAFQLLAQQIRRTYGRFEYLRVFEVGAKTGVGHLHVAFYGSYIAQGWLSKAWESYTGYAVVHIESADGTSARYMAKSLVGYMAKGDPRISKADASRGWVPVVQRSLTERVLDELGKARVSRNEARIRVVARGR